MMRIIDFCYNNINLDAEYDKNLLDSVSSGSSVVVVSASVGYGIKLIWLSETGCYLLRMRRPESGVSTIFLKWVDISPDENHRFLLQQHQPRIWDKAYLAKRNRLISIKVLSVVIHFDAEYDKNVLDSVSSGSSVVVVSASVDAEYDKNVLDSVSSGSSVVVVSASVGYGIKLIWLSETG
ncbi:hypothetical protein QVD17_15218 [Tagetes erecta]|uniref:Uncharacterized protein n=1 Tax=Tagetes erecta TaxID=13708 RepID=A0AAD8NZH6_TARER|nr:hypothetical protein QVD17_15218 [Tagetes erecta]